MLFESIEQVEMHQYIGPYWMGTDKRKIDISAISFFLMVISKCCVHVCSCSMQATWRAVGQITAPRVREGVGQVQALLSQDKAGSMGWVV